MQRPCFSELEVGGAIPVRFEQAISQEMIDAWAFVSEDFNPLHVDPNFGKTTPFGSTISHGTLTITYIMEMMTRWLGEHWLRGGALKGMRFVAPVRSGDTVRPGGEIAEKRVVGDRQVVECNVWLELADGTRAIVGTASAHLE